MRKFAVTLTEFGNRTPGVSGQMRIDYDGEYRVSDSRGNVATYASDADPNLSLLLSLAHNFAHKQAGRPPLPRIRDITDQVSRRPENVTRTNFIWPSDKPTITFMLSEDEQRDLLTLRERLIAWASSANEPDAISLVEAIATIDRILHDRSAVPNA